MAPRKRSAAPANTTVVCRVRRRGIDTVLRCAAKTNTPPSTRRHHVLSNDLQGLVWDMDADTPLGRALQNECATRPCVAERHTAVRSAYWSLTLAARKFAAAKTVNLPMASAKTKARLYTRRVRGPGSSPCAKTKGQAIYARNARTRIVAIKLNMPHPFLCISARLVHTSEFSPGEMGQEPLRSRPLDKPTQLPHWQAAAEAVMMAAEDRGPLMHARVARR